MTMALKSFSVWYDNDAQWDPDHFDEPELRCRASTAIAAAEQLADASEAKHCHVIVRDDATGVYRQIELVREWMVKWDAETTIEKLSAP